LNDAVSFHRHTQGRQDQGDGRVVMREIALRT
jgi:hypothetical protein